MRFGFLHTLAWQKTVTYGLVTIITILVWLYAEAENVKIHEENAVEIAVEGAKTQLIELEKPGPLRVAVQFRCAAGQLSELRKLCRQSFTINVADMDAGEQTIELKARLGLDQGIADLGVAIEAVDPARIRATITDLEAVEMQIVARSGGQDLDTLDPKVTPARATVLMPAARADISAMMQLVAEVDESALADLGEGEHEIPDVPVTVPPHLRKQNIRNLPATAKVRVTVRKQEKTIARSVPIYVLNTPSISEDFEIIPDEDFVTVDLTGPVETIDRIHKNNIQVWAELHFFSHADLSASAEETTLTYALEFHLPPNVRPSVSSYQMPVKIRRRDAVPETEGP